jgi:endonuclease III
MTLEEKALEVYRVLLTTYGERELVPRREPMHELVSTILSQRTNWKNEELAYTRMWNRFGSWEAVRDAPTSELAEAIALSNFAEAKAPQIQRTVGTILELRGDTDLGFLRDLPVEEGLEWLTALPGVGVKTATLVLLFCFAKPVLPVDTHVYRVSQRVGLLSAKVKTRPPRTPRFSSSCRTSRTCCTTFTSPASCTVSASAPLTRRGAAAARSRRCATFLGVRARPNTLRTFVCRRLWPG